MKRNQKINIYIEDLNDMDIKNGNFGYHLWEFVRGNKKLFLRIAEILLTNQS